MNEPGDDIIPRDERSIAIDVLRGVAILWVVLFHLWGLSVNGIGFGPGRATYYERFLDRLGEGSGIASFTALTDLFFRIGDDGVAVFIMLSGVSLTALVSRRGSIGSLVPFYWRRLTRLLIPYWVAWLLFIATLAALALYRTEFDGGTFSLNFQYVRFTRVMSMDLALSGLLLVPRGLDLARFSAGPPALWFVLLLLQFYLLFPLLYRVLQIIGPFSFAALCLGVSVAATALMIYHYGDVRLHGYVLSMWAPFRIFEFALGMSIGWLFVASPGRMLQWIGAWPRLVVFVAIAVTAHAVGSNITDDHGYWRAWSQPLIVVGLGGVIIAACVVAARRPGLFANPPMRLLSWIGTISYGVLIVNESFRVVHLYLVAKGWQWTPGWWFFVVVLYVPLTVLLAYPLSVMLRLVPPPRRRGGSGSACAPAQNPEPSSPGATSESVH